MAANSLIGQYSSKKAASSHDRKVYLVATVDQMEPQIFCHTPGKGWNPQKFAVFRAHAKVVSVESLNYNPAPAGALSQQLRHTHWAPLDYTIAPWNSPEGMAPDISRALQSATPAVSRTSSLTGGS